MYFKSINKLEQFRANHFCIVFSKEISQKNKPKPSSTNGNHFRIYFFTHIISLDDFRLNRNLTQSFLKFMFRKWPAAWNTLVAWMTLRSQHYMLFIIQKIKKSKIMEGGAIYHISSARWSATSLHYNLIK